MYHADAFGVESKRYEEGGVKIAFRIFGPLFVYQTTRPDKSATFC